MWRTFIAPILFYSDKGSLVQYWSDQRIHLRHVTTKPKQPTAYANQQKDYLNYASMWIFGHENWQDTTNHPEYGTEQNNG